MAGTDGLRRVVVADAGPLIALSLVGQLDLLRELFNRIEISNQVGAEVLDAGTFPGQAEVRTAIDEGWLHWHSVDLSSWCARYPGIDEGEASALALAEQFPRALLIMDDRAGRSEALARGLELTGTAAVVGLAKLRGRIPLAAPIFAAMRANGYFIGDEIIQAVLMRIGETCSSG
jgi:predicted nucleic acid-binding protein